MGKNWSLENILKFIEFVRWLSRDLNLDLSESGAWAFVTLPDNFQMQLKVWKGL